MKIADLFINLLIKDDNKAEDKLKGVKGTLGEISTAGLAAKATILGIVYGLQQLTSNSAKAGANLSSYAAATGLSAENLQRMQFAGRQFNVESDEMQQNLVNLQSLMMKMSMGQGAPSGFGVVANAVGIDMKRVRDTEYMISKLNEYAKKEKNVDFANEQLKSFGFSMNMIAASRRGAFDEKNLKRAPVYSNGEVEQLRKVDVAWANMGKSIEMAIGHLTAKHGLGFAKEIGEAAKSLMHLITAFVNLAEKINLIKDIGMIFEGWGMIFEAIGLAIDKLNQLASGPKKSDQENKKLQYDQWLKSNPNAGESEKQFYRQSVGYDPTKDLLKKAAIPTIKPGHGGHKTTNQSIKTTVINHGVKDAKEGAHHTKRAIQDAARQIPQSQVN